MANVWLTGDTHFGHANIIKYCNRPFRTSNEMDRTLMNNWNEVVKPEDTVIHVGDFSFGGFNSYYDRLNGRKTLLKGNHDKTAISEITAVILKYKQKEFFCTHRVENYSPEYMYQLVGHVHEKWQIKRLPLDILAVNVGVDVWDYKPVNIEEVVKLINTKGRTLNLEVETFEREISVISPFPEIPKSDYTFPS